MKMPRRGSTLRQRGSKPAKQKSEDKQQEERRRRLEVQEVAKRVERKGGKCELGCDRLADDCHHVWGRGHVSGIPEKVCWMKESMLGICRECHDAIHNGDVDLMREAQVEALVMFADTLGVVAMTWARVVANDPPEDPLEAMRRLVREWEARECQ